MRSRVVSTVAFLGALAAAGTGCAGPRAEAPPPPFLPYKFAPQPGEPAASPSAERPPDAASPANPGAAVRLEASLIAFAVEQRTSRAECGGPMPPPVVRRWADLLAVVDAFLKQPPGRTAPLALVRARVAVDAELGMDAACYGSLPGGLDALVRARVLALDGRLRQVRLLVRQAVPPPSPLLWPVDPVLVTSLFGYRTDPLDGSDRHHKGIDLKAGQGQLIQVAAAGVVVRAGQVKGHGMHVEIRHDDSLTTRYSHLSLVLVQPGQRLPAGGPVGLAGSTGRATGPHLHFEVWRDGEPVDPLAELPDPPDPGSRQAGMGW